MILLTDMTAAFHTNNRSLHSQLTAKLKMKSLWI